MGIERTCNNLPVHTQPSGEARQMRQRQPLEQPKRDQRGGKQRQQSSEHQQDHDDPSHARRNPRGRWRTERIVRSEEHTSELQSLMRISYDVFCLKKKTAKKLPDPKTRTYHTTLHVNIL